MRAWVVGLVVVAAVGVSSTLAGCGGSKADVAASNISKAAEQFQVYRRILVINGITDKYLFEGDGAVSVVHNQRRQAKLQLEPGYRSEGEDGPIF